MTAKKRSPLYQREQEMIEAFYDYKRSTPQSSSVDRRHLALDSLSELFQRGKAGEGSSDPKD